MKRRIKKYFAGFCLLSGALALGSCNDFLDREPLDSVTPQAYLNNENDLAAYAIKAYSFDTHSGWGLGTLTGDNNTDNMCSADPSYDLWVPQFRRVPNKSDNFSFSSIRNCNYFFEQVKPRLAAGAITGNEENINHYIGEMYFLRAWEYFKKLKTYGDFPILTQTLPDDKELLIAISQRKPRNEVARFIINNLDSAIVLLKADFKNKNRLTKNAAYLLKSRVALYEASWETYHRNTPFVPGGPGWPGAKAAYNQGFTIDLDAEIAYFLDQAMSAAKEVADNIPLSSNSHVMNPTTAANGWNPYFDMFSAEDMGTFPEVLFWRAYSKSLNITHGVSVYIRNGGSNGLTKGFVDTYLMKSGLPIYADPNYKGDRKISDQKAGRDERLQLFMFADGDKHTMLSDTAIFKVPTILDLVEVRDITGYRARKCYNYDPAQAPSSGLDCTYGSIVFRAAEAYLNYMEACYIKNRSLDATAQRYWAAIRERAGVDPDYNKTIAATDLSRENDWGKYSAGSLVDATLYNIRRERRCEFLGESFRMDDLKRWRALDQVKNYIPEGFNLWDEVYKDESFYSVDEKGNRVSLLIEPGDGRTPNVSSRNDSKYLLPYRIIEKNNQVYDGYTWSKANYLTPLPAYEILLTTQAVAEGEQVDLGSSPLYQNPYWPLVANESASE